MAAGVVLSETTFARIMRAVAAFEAGRGGRGDPSPSNYRGNETQVMLGKTVVASSKGNTAGAEVVIYSGTPGSETVTATSLKVTAFNHFTDIAADEWTLVASVNGSAWYNFPAGGGDSNYKEHLQFTFNQDMGDDEVDTTVTVVEFYGAGSQDPTTLDDYDGGSFKVRNTFGWFKALANTKGRANYRNSGTPFPEYEIELADPVCDEDTNGVTSNPPYPGTPDQTPIYA